MEMRWRLPQPTPSVPPGTKTTFHETQGSPTGFVVGVDLGQAKDFTAVVVNERMEAQQITFQHLPGAMASQEAGRKSIILHRFTALFRFQLGTPYPEVAERVGGLLAKLPPRRDKPELFVDKTGVGRAVLDTMKEKGLRPIGITITGGIDPSRPQWDDWRIPKGALASLMQAALQTGRLKIAEAMELTPLLKRELETFKVKISAAGNESFEAWREADHDDLVLAAAIAVWGAQNRVPPMRAMRINFIER